MIASDSPLVPILGCSDSSTTKDDLVFHKIPLSGGEDGAMSDQEISSNVRIGDDDEKLGAHPDGEEGSVFLRPVVQCKLGILAKKGITNRRSWRQGISILVGNPVAEIYGRQEVEGCGYHRRNKKIVKTGGNKL